MEPVERVVHVQVDVRLAAARRGDGEAAVRRVRRGVRRVDARRRALHQRHGQPVRLVPVAHARRPHQSLGADLAALRPRRLPPEEPRRSRRRLADHLRGHEAVLRSRRLARRHLRQQRGPAERSRRRVPAAAQAALLRAAHQAGRRPAEDHVHRQPVVDPHAAAERPHGVPLLRPVRPRLRAALEFLVAVGADSAGDGDQEADDRRQRHGARGDGRRDRQGDGRRLHRQEHRAREPRPGAHRRAGRERLRVGAHPPQLEVGEVSAGPRQFHAATSASI